MSSNFTPVPENVWKTIAALSADMVEKAKSGHPGTAMGAAEAMSVLWADTLRFDPLHPEWMDRDRFVLSAGHASALLYSLLHLFGYPDMTLDELKNFRQWGSRTAGHPEYGEAPGIETTTGPLGQGIANAVGLALGQGMLAARFNTEDFSPVTGRVYALSGDGCLMEGISYEACSLAGHLGLGSLTLIYDRNKITIEGSTDITFTEDVAKRFEAMRWQVLEVDGYDQKALFKALEKSKAERKRPTIIIMTTNIGRLAPKKQDSPKAHGEPLGAEEIRGFKQALGWPDTAFHVPAEAAQWCLGRVREKRKERAAWEEGMKAWKARHPDLAAQWDAHIDGVNLADLDAALTAGQDLAAAGATRKHSGTALNLAAKVMPGLVGGSADLAGSNLSDIKGGGDIGIAKDRDMAASLRGRILHFGVREHAMAAIVNGLNLHGAFRAFCATFLQFADYMRPAIRLSALMKVKSVFLFTHDSIFLGEDGPTHQAVEHMAALRLIPGLQLWRPADYLETAMAWSWILSRADGPACLLGSRQSLPALQYPVGFDRRQIWKGAYVLREEADAACTLIGTGSEVSLCCAAADELKKKGISARVVSMPCVEAFDALEEKEKKAVLGLKPLAVVEAGRSGLWRGLVGTGGLVIGLDRFGASAPAEVLAEKFGFTPAQVAGKVAAWIKK